MSTPPNDPNYGQGQSPRDPSAGQPTPGQNPAGPTSSPYGSPNTPPANYNYPGNMSQVAMTEKGPAPKEVERAFWLIIAAGVVSLISTILSTVTTPVQGPGADVATAIGLVFAAIVTGVYILLAIFIRKGHNWARITAAVLAVLSVLMYLFGLMSASMLEGSDLMQGQEMVTPGPLETILGLLGLLLGIAGVVMTFLKPARPYFEKQTAPGQY
ncbi:hypothetical protein [Arthrobacter sp. 260]|uniref:hypothetical protein n=1 Tax=Arthrobacter sp. 260 TaxID=2735314 RepID=UPI00149154A4|nr:hypothetical protein [Arthrobacter sp. 260]NOJ60173.1 hypothetical protein [Arthrobacter sp. 260]